MAGQENKSMNENLYLLLNMGDFQLAMLVYQRVNMVHKTLTCWDLDRIV